VHLSIPEPAAQTSIRLHIVERNRAGLVCESAGESLKSRFEIREEALNAVPPPARRRGARPVIRSPGLVNPAKLDVDTDTQWEQESVPCR
jgi:hypothetical protein